MEEVSKEELQTTIIMSFKKDKKAKAKWVDGQFFIVFYELLEDDLLNWG